MVVEALYSQTRLPMFVSCCFWISIWKTTFLPFLLTIYIRSARIGSFCISVFNSLITTVLGEIQAMRSWGLVCTNCLVKLSQIFAVVTASSMQHAFLAKILFPAHGKERASSCSSG